MASTVRADVEIKDLYEDLQAAGQGLEKVIAHEVRRAADDVASGAKHRMREGTQDWAVGAGQVQLPHIRDTYSVTGRGLVAEVGSFHPGAPVWEWGGIIHPRGMFVQTIVIPGLHPVGEAADEDLDLFEVHLQKAVDRLLAQFHL